MTQTQNPWAETDIASKIITIPAGTPDLLDQWATTVSDADQEWYREQVHVDPFELLDEVR